MRRAISTITNEVKKRIVLGKYNDKRWINKSIVRSYPKPNQVYTHNDINPNIPDITKRVVRKKRYTISGQIKEKVSL